MSPRMYPVSVKGPVAVAAGAALAFGAAAAAALLCSKSPPPPDSAAGSTVGCSADCSAGAAAGASGGTPPSLSARAMRAPAQQSSNARLTETLIAGLNRGPGPLAGRHHHRVAGRRAAEDDPIAAL